MGALEHCKMAVSDRVTQNISRVLKSWVRLLVCFECVWSFCDFEFIRKNLPTVGSNDAGFERRLNIRLIE